MPLIRSELAQSIGTITLDNPAKRNALCTTLVGEIIDALAGFELEKARVVVLRAAPGVKCTNRSASRVTGRMAAAA